MKKYSWVQKIGKSLMPSEFYIEILQEPLWRAFGYMTLFILLLSVLTGTYNGYIQKESYDTLLTNYTRHEIPEFTVTPTEFSMDGVTPVVMDLFGFSIILDDEAIYTINDIIDKQKTILFGKNKITIVNNTINPIFYQYKDLFRLSLIKQLTSTDIANILPVLSKVAIPVTILTQFFLSLFSFIFDGIFVLLIVNIIHNLLKLTIKFKQLIHMTIYAMTFSIFWTSFIDILPNGIPYSLDILVYYGVPTTIIFNVFLYIRKCAIDETNH